MPSYIFLGCHTTIKRTNEDFDAKFGEIQSALFDYLIWFEIGPHLTEDKSSGLLKVKWDESKDGLEARKFIARLVKLLSHLRCVAKTWDTENTQGSQYGYSVSLPEDPGRAATLLTNLAKGHASLEGRNYISKNRCYNCSKDCLIYCADRKGKYFQSTSGQWWKLDNIGDNRIFEHKQTDSLENNGRDQCSRSCR
ncbi:MAG: hypothetical protein WA667_07140 [Candidatus Nitrosopolaris sp.]